MNRILNFIFWPALAGLVFGLVVLQMPRLAALFPALSPGADTGTARVERFDTFGDAFAKAAPAVVSINSTADITRVGEEYVNLFMKQKVLLNEENTSLGSGVIISSDGYIITSFHIFQIQVPEVIWVGNGEITVTLFDGRSVEARVLLVNENEDLALLKVDAENLPYIDIAQEGTLDEGDIVLAIGNPRNIGLSVTQGIISGLRRKDDSFVIQTDAAINPGNSGGALIDVDGKLIGINSTIVSESGGFEGISFAIPAREAISLMQRYIEKGPGGYLGVDGEYLSLRQGRLLFGEDLRGFMVNRVPAASPADKAGIQVRDVITSIDGLPIDSGEAVFSMIEKISKLGPGETVMADVFRNGERLKLPIVLGIGEPRLYLSEPKPQPRQILDPNPFGETLL